MRDLSVGDRSVGDRSVVALVTERSTRHGSALDLDRALEYTVADGRILTCRIYETDQDAIDAWLGGTPGG